MSLHRAILPLLFVSLLVACDGDVTAPEPTPTGTITSNSSAGWAYVDLAATATPVTVADPLASLDWDIAFNATRVMLNGGAMGPGGVVGYCICQNRGATTDQVLAMTPDSELADFEAVRAADIPGTSGGWAAEVFEAADVAGSAGPRWYKYNLLGTNQVTPTFNVYLIKRGSEVYKVQLTGYYGPAGETRRITMRYARLAD